MSYAEAHTVELTTDASGDAIGYTPVITGKIATIIYVKDDLADGVDFTITTEKTEQNLWVESNVNSSKTVSPRQATHDTSGVASLYAGSGEPVEDYIIAASERVKIVVAQGGDTKNGTFKIIVA